MFELFSTRCEIKKKKKITINGKPSFQRMNHSTVQ